MQLMQIHVDENKLNELTQWVSGDRDWFDWPVIPVDTTGAATEAATWEYLIDSHPFFLMCFHSAIKFCLFVAHISQELLLIQWPIINTGLNTGHQLFYQIDSFAYSVSVLYRSMNWMKCYNKYNIVTKLFSPLCIYFIHFILHYFSSNPASWQENFILMIQLIDKVILLAFVW